MAQKNYAQMPTKKLNALLEKVTDENEKAAIEEVLAKRGQLASGDNAPATVNPNAELSAEEQAAIDAANGTDADASEKQAANTKKAKVKPTDEERAALAAKLREEAVGHKCQVVPFNSIEWVNGVIVAIVEEKRTNKCLYAVKADDGRRIVKAYGSELIKISDEVVELTRTPRGGGKSKEELPEWTHEEIEKAVQEVIGNVGKQISYVETGALGAEIENAQTILGRIISLVPNKRNHTILYRIEIQPAEDAPEGTPKKYAHKVTTNDKLAIAEELDDEGKKINEAFIARRNGERKTPTAKTPEEALAIAEQQLKKAEEHKAKAEASIEKWTAKIEEIKAKIGKDNSEAEAAPSEENAGSETGTNDGQSDDLM
jgi:hypothetical protein